jgi:hypothetical protein
VLSTFVRTPYSHNVWGEGGTKKKAMADAIRHFKSHIRDAQKEVARLQAALHIVADTGRFRIKRARNIR